MTDSDVPFIDEHETEIDAPVDDVWAALVEQVSRLFGGGLAPWYARAVRCDDQTAAGPRPMGEGSTIPGFRVTTLVSPSELVLDGRHRFSTYSLRFRLEPIDRERSRLCAETRATFPGVSGRVYRFVVIGTGGHEVAVRRLLTRVKRAALYGRRTARP